MQSITGDKGEKAAFVVCNLSLTFAWLRFLVRLITRWHVMPTNIRDAVALFMMFFSLLWLALVREKRAIFLF
jgi:hypothetical protein